jgi:hypothetical protein
MKKSIFITLGVLQAFIALGALPAGFSMIVQPDGSDLGMTLDLLKNSHFNNFLIPGLFLFFVNGVCQTVAAVLSFKRHKCTASAALVLGMFMILWICVQTYSIGYLSFMQPMFFIIGLLELSLGMIILKAGKSNL